MKHLLYLLLVSSFSSALAATPFEDLVGCYNTIKWNGNPISAQGPRHLSTIKVGYSMVALNMDDSKIPSVEMVLFQRRIGNTIYFGYAFPMLNQGSYSQENGKSTFTFNGRVKYRPQPEHVGTLTHTVEFERLSSGNIWLHNYINVVETSEFNVDETYELEPTACNSGI
jgi:hypothetical protein